VLWFTRSGGFFFGVQTTPGQSLTVSSGDRSFSAATAPPRKPDTPKQVAAENMGRLADADASHGDSVKGHAA
jgi:hypothetical protein